jgi:biotin carboxyl carrier protein
MKKSLVKKLVRMAKDGDPEAIEAVAELLEEVAEGEVIEPAEEAAEAVAEAAPAAAAAAGTTPVNSPMPGTILDIKVAVGQAVKEGDLVCILEAMKMENEIYAPCSGSVAQVLVTKDQSVDTGAPLVTIS